VSARDRQAPPLTEITPSLPYRFAYADA